MTGKATFGFISVLAWLYLISALPTSAEAQPYLPSAQSAESRVESSRARVGFIFEHSCPEDSLTNPVLEENAVRKIDTRIKDAQETWWTQSVKWKYVYWLALGCSVFLSTFVAASFLKDFAYFPVKSVASFGAALAAAFLGTINPQAHADRYLRGHIYMQSALIHYTHNQRMTPCELAQAYAQAEAIVHGGASSFNASAAR
jgi:hypothetical protein